MLFHASGAKDVANARAALFSARTGVTHTAALAALAFQLPEESATTSGGTIGVSVPERTRLVLQSLGVPRHDSDNLAHELSEIGRCANVALAPSLDSTLAELRDVPHTIVSNTRWTSGETLRHMLDASGLGSTFSGLAFSDEVGWAKPNPRLFEAAWRPLSVSPSATVHIGDRVSRDVAGARAFGSGSILCRVLRRKRERGDGSADGLLYDYVGLDGLLQLLSGCETPRGWHLVAEGLPVWGPPVAGRIRRVEKSYTVVDEGHVLLLESSGPEFVPFYTGAAAVIAKAGGYGSHAAQTAPLFDTPCVVGLGSLADAFEEDAIVLIDTPHGRIFQRDDVS